jgi:hypothetical protein
MERKISKGTEQNCKFENANQYVRNVTVKTRWNSKLRLLISGVGRFAFVVGSEYQVSLTFCRVMELGMGVFFFRVHFCFRLRCNAPELSMNHTTFLASELSTTYNKALCGG